MTFYSIPLHSCRSIHPSHPPSRSRPHSCICSHSLATLQFFTFLTLTQGRFYPRSLGYYFPPCNESIGGLSGEQRQLEVSGTQSSAFGRIGNYPLFHRWASTIHPYSSCTCPHSRNRDRAELIGEYITQHDILLLEVSLLFHGLKLRIPPVFDHRGNRG